jgi:opacity protein-like surface antigen
LDITTYGLVGSRVELSGSGGYSSGSIGLGAQAEGLDSFTGTVGVRVGLVRYLALDAEYAYYHYLFDEGSLLPPGVSRGLNRNGIRAGVTVWVPLLR